MEVVPVSTVLSEHPRRLAAPRLFALQANDALYTVLGLQPQGRIRITETSIGHADAGVATGLANDFFRLALEVKPDLLVCPEYSVPWEVLLQLIESGAGPEVGKLSAHPAPVTEREIVSRSALGAE